MPSIKTAYEQLKKKFVMLPSFEVLDREFGISLIEKEEWLLKGIKARIYDTIRSTAEFIESILQPDPMSYQNIYESKCFNTDERDEIFKSFRKLMLLLRKIDESNFVLDDKTDAETINFASREWSLLRKELLPKIKKLQECWIEKPEKGESLEYFG